MKGFKAMFSKKKSKKGKEIKAKGKGKDKNKQYDEDERPPAYFNVAPEWGSASAPMFGYDEYIESQSSIQSLKIQFRYSLEVTVDYPFANFFEALQSMRNWKIDYTGYQNKKSIYNIIMMYATKRLRAGPRGLQGRKSTEYSAEGSGRYTLHHDLGDLSGMRFAEERFVRTWQDQLRRGTINFYVWLGETDDNSNLPPLICPGDFKDASEFNMSCEIMGIRVEVQPDNQWVVKEA
ncbi:matrix [Vesiculovirus radi]|uniref:Matrix protein n=1 Tax=Vesiculovirus radi TaxID=1972566 RepID=A0A0D3R1M7_9RHAB|nr:matrix [Vesiculovirus radi]AJR28594.1 matrix [Vesiculovirus radi]